MSRRFSAGACTCTSCTSGPCENAIKERINLPDAVYGSTVDYKQRVWLGGNGVKRYDPKAPAASRYTKSTDDFFHGIAADAKWRPLVEAYAKHDAAQCGYCTPGQFTVAKYIIEKYGKPIDEQIRAELAGNICRCGTYSRHVQAIQEAAAAIEGGN